VTKTVTIKANQAPYNYVTRTQAISLAEGFKNQQGYKAKTKLVSSYAWDTTIAFLQKVNSDYGSSSEEGNYNNTTFSYIDITGASKTKEKNSNVLVPTGQTTPVCNIYDMGGNIWEWTTERCSLTDGPYALRGGTCYNNFTSHPAGFRFSYSAVADALFGFRLTLFM
jgi:formylglycine-generating enzyme required for sulfatase activity